MTNFKYVELFAGIGGFRAGLDKLGGECVLAVEWDKFAQQSYTALYGNEHLLGDVTKVDENEVPDHDVLVFGMPCQAFSVAGKRLGFEDMRGTLYFEALRIAKAKKPKVLWMENVKGLVGHDGGRTLDVMAQAMSDIGYTIDFDVLNSKYFGVPQNRERIFMIGIRDDLVSQKKWTIEGTNVVAKGKKRIAAYDGIKTFNFDFPEQTEVTTRLRDVLETEVDEKYYLSDEKTAKLVAQLTENDSDIDKVGYIASDKYQNLVHGTSGIMPTIACGNSGGKRPGGFIQERSYPVECSKCGRDDFSYEVNGFDCCNCGNEHEIDGMPKMVGHIELRGHDAIKRVYATEGIAPTLTTMGGGHREPKIAELQGLPIREATKQGYAIATEGDAVNFQFPDSKTRRGRVGKQIANTLEASNINQGVVERDEPLGELDIVGTSNEHGHVGTNKVYGIDGISPTLLARDYKDAKRVLVDSPRYRIRKLTPLECWRLQGFTDTQHQTVVDAGLSDSQRYKQAGNAVTVNVIHAIGAKLLPYLR